MVISTPLPSILLTLHKKRKRTIFHSHHRFVVAGLPDFAEVYSFIGSVFDPETTGHVQKLKEMDPINFETVSYTEHFSQYGCNCLWIV